MSGSVCLVFLFSSEYYDFVRNNYFEPEKLNRESCNFVTANLIGLVTCDDSRHNKRVFIFILLDCLIEYEEIGETLSKSPV